MCSSPSLVPRDARCVLCPPGPCNEPRGSLAPWGQPQSPHLGVPVNQWELQTCPSGNRRDCRKKASLGKAAAPQQATLPAAPSIPYPLGPSQPTKTPFPALRWEPPCVPGKKATKSCIGPLGAHPGDKHPSSPHLPVPVTSHRRAKGKRGQKNCVGLAESRAVPHNPIHPIPNPIPGGKSPSLSPSLTLLQPGQGERKFSFIAASSLPGTEVTGTGHLSGSPPLLLHP